MGAYYTPEEITGFMTRQTIHPYLLDKLNSTVDAEYGEIDDVFGFPGIEASVSEEAVTDGGTMTRQVPPKNVETKHVETLYHDILKEAKILDPAVGSGAFLLAAQDVLVDIYMQCIEYFQQLEQEGQGWELDSRTRDELDEINSGQGGASLFAKRTAILNNLYGVDIDDGAVEICKLRLWLSMVADIEDEPNEVEPLPNIDFNIRQGNSLIGYVSDIEEAIDAVDEDDLVQATIGSFGENSVRRAIEEISEAIENHKKASSSAEATEWRHKANNRLEKYRNALDQKIVTEFQSALDEEDISLEDINRYSPFHWVIEFPAVFQDGGFDVAVGNPPWDKVKAERDDFFPKYDEIFRNRMPNDKDQKQRELLESDEIREGWDDYQEQIKTEAKYYNESPSYELQSPQIDGRITRGENDSSALFLERVFSLVSDTSYVAQILPAVIYQGGSKKDLRNHLLDHTSIQTFIQFENHGVFDTIDSRYRFCILTFQNSGSKTQVSRSHQLFADHRQTDVYCSRLTLGSLPLPRQTGRYH